jgi:hypothetical protein
VSKSNEWEGTQLMGQFSWWKLGLWITKTDTWNLTANSAKL